MPGAWWRQLLQVLCRCASSGIVTRGLEIDKICVPAGTAIVVKRPWPPLEDCLRVAFGIVVVGVRLWQDRFGGVYAG